MVKKTYLYYKDEPQLACKTVPPWLSSSCSFFILLCTPGTDRLSLCSFTCERVLFASPKHLGAKVAPFSCAMYVLSARVPCMCCHLVCHVCVVSQCVASHPLTFRCPGICVVSQCAALHPLTLRCPGVCVVIQCAASNPLTFRCPGCLQHILLQLICPSQYVCPRLSVLLSMFVLAYVLDTFHFVLAFTLTPCFSPSCQGAANMSCASLPPYS